jgi:hypothetical protein
MTNHMISLMISSTTEPRCLEPLSKLNPGLNFVAELFFNQCINLSYLIIELANYVIMNKSCNYG